MVEQEVTDSRRVEVGRTIQSLAGHVERLLIALGALLVLALLLTVVLQVFSRAVLQGSIPWTEELTRFLFLWSVFVAAGPLARRSGHMSMQLLQQKVPNRIAKIMEAVVATVLVYLGIVITVSTLGQMDLSWARREPTLPFSAAYKYLSVLVFSATTVFFVLADVLTELLLKSARYAGRVPQRDAS